MNLHQRLQAQLAAEAQNVTPTLNAKLGRRSVSSRIAEYQTTRMRADLTHWRNALSMAEQLHLPDRTELLRLYREAVIDAHLASVMETRALNLLSQPFKVVAVKGGAENEELTRMLQAPWFYTLCMEAVHSIFWGPRVLEFRPPVDGEFAGIDLIQPEMVIPERGLIRDAPLSQTGLSYVDGPEAPWLIQLGESRELGLLHKLIPHVVWKKNSMQAWAEYCDRFALPVRTVEMDLNDEDRVEVENMLRNMGRAAYAILPPGASNFQYHQPQTFQQGVFAGMIDYPNREMSKAVLGQTMTTEDGSSRSQGEVHERVAEKYTQADKTYLRNLIMWKLWDKLLVHGYPVAGFEFKWDDTEQLKKKELWDIVQGVMQHSGYRVPAQYIKDNFGIEVEEKPEPELVPTPAPAGTNPPRPGKPTARA
ncbi:DUF935 domain-containing protein [Hymenobacter sp. 15J16-1T3B]|uniref:phage portal protein family protein n=1 Tax=Hymenobacter sp. 15J16-1T3B TaxID=2886941 RepID=UPI001D12FE28|nr:DUF935 family protein [Hymenobacter sp. 15J16-1T3B]MCC3159506.1 DUF935 domain-containing protein [Hymenobacter sp. 15J16-1T3B]